MVQSANAQQLVFSASNANFARVPGSEACSGE